MCTGNNHDVSINLQLYSPKWSGGELETHVKDQGSVQSLNCLQILDICIRVDPKSVAWKTALLFN